MPRTGRINACRRLCPPSPRGSGAGGVRMPRAAQAPSPSSASQRHQLIKMMRHKITSINRSTRFVPHTTNTSQEATTEYVLYSVLIVL